MKHGVAVLFASAVVACFFACSTPPSDARIGVEAPSRANYPPVADLLDHSCGTLDCHGTVQRNLVMWGCYGMRLDPTATPGCRSMGGTNSTPAEYDDSYRSLVGLEPAVMSDVVANHGANPNELTFVRKAFGEEAHKGGLVFQLGSDADTCIASWLAGTTNTTACANALASAP
jgi:hypothetical protein